MRKREVAWAASFFLAKLEIRNLISNFNSKLQLNISIPFYNSNFPNS